MTHRGRINFQSKKHHSYSASRHFRRNMIARYDLDPDESMRERIVKMITGLPDPRVILLEKSTNAVSIWGVFIEQPVVVVYNKNIHQLVTALPKESEYYQTYVKMIGDKKP